MEKKQCIVCCELIANFAVGKCNHREVCHVCSLRMRSLYHSNSCSFCKENLEEVFYTNDDTTLFSDFKREQFCSNNQKGIWFQTLSLKSECQNLLKFTCPVPSCHHISINLKEARQHLALSHPHLFLCTVCVKTRKIFFHEHKLYTKSQLASHIRTGDLNDTSFKGHPLCKFCSQAFYSKDELYEHLELSHEHCFICRKNGIFDQYYQNYASLEDHFRKSHFICEDTECRSKAFVVFRNEIDLHLHMTNVHQEKKKKSILLDTTLRRKANESELTPRAAQDLTFSDQSSTVRSNEDKLRSKLNIKSRVPEGFGKLSSHSSPPKPESEDRKITRPEDFPVLTSSPPNSAKIFSPYKTAITKAPQNSSLNVIESFPALVSKSTPPSHFKSISLPDKKKKSPAM